MTLEYLTSAALVLAAIPAVMTILNLAFYRTPPRPAADGSRPSVSVLIPARDEERSIGRSVEAALASRDVDLEVVVMDDHSEDRTVEIVQSIAERDPRVRLESAPLLPPGWCGKQHACHALAKAASYPVLTFVDADVELAPEGLRRMLAFLETSRAELISGIPRQKTGTLIEKLVIPVIHFVLLGFLPMAGIRWSRLPGFAAGCGQLFMTRREAYETMGGHATIKSSRHDGITLPRAFRESGFKTDLFDATGVASCRMYRGARELWRGFAKNATEGMASPAAIVPWTVLLAGGQILPPVLLVVSALLGWTDVLATAALATALGFGTRWIQAVRFRQSVLGAALHPAGIAIVVAIQWDAWWRARRGREVTWKGRLQLDTTRGTSK